MHRNSLQCPPGSSHSESSDISKEMEHNENLVLNDNNTKQYVTPIRIQPSGSIHCWQEKKEKSKDQPPLIGISIPVKCTEKEILIPQTALSSSVESPVMNPKISAHYRYPRCQNNNVASSTSKTQDPEIKKSYQVEEKLKTFRNFSVINSSDSSVWIDDILSGSTASRTVSFCTTFDEDESPILPRVRESLKSPRELANQKLRVDTVAAQRCSWGWWNYIISPFLSTSSSLPSSEQEFDEKSFSDTAMITPSVFTECKKENQRLKSKILSRSKTPDIKNSHLELYLKNTEVKSVTSSTPQIQRAMSGIRTTPIEASFHAPSELDLIHMGCIQKDDLSKKKYLNKLEKKLSLHSKYPEIKSEFSSRGSISSKYFPKNSDITLSKSSSKKNLPGGIFQQSRNNLPPALYVPSADFLSKNTKSNSKSEALQSSMPQKSKSFNTKIPRLQKSTMSLKSSYLISEVLLSPSIPQATQNIPKNLEIPAISNGGNYPEKYLQGINRELTTKGINSRINSFINPTSRYDVSQGVPKLGSCFCKSPENRKRSKRQKQYFSLALFVIFIIVITLLISMAHVKPKRSNAQSQWLNLTEFPPIFLGFSTVISPVLVRESSTCVTPATQWSCHLPKELQSSVKNDLTNQPNFFIQIDWDNSAEANTTFSTLTSNRTSIRQIYRHKVTNRRPLRYSRAENGKINYFRPDPAPPLIAEEWFLGTTTDGIVSTNKAGEPTPFYVSFLETAKSSVEKYKIISSQNSFPNVSSIIPPPNLLPDGTAAPANLLPYVSNQLLKLYDRGLPTEHFGFYNYFDRSIFLKSVFLDINDVGSRLTPEDLNGGAARAEASYRCTWSQTRFLIQIWTRKKSIHRFNHTFNQEKDTAKNTVLQQPGSFPYPITITIDRHGGNPMTKTLYCYKLDKLGGLDADSGYISTEFRGSGGILINPAPTIFTNNSDSNIGGFDGGNSGCLCQWSNFQEILYK
ncbi:hypothetical protein HI914_02302 [Erysiphe necator]|nr:hypothetical protein HI914_02302 [Erysiphe necator]